MRGVTLNTGYLFIIFKFQLTRLMRGVTRRHYSLYNRREFQLTRLMRGVTPLRLFQLIQQ